MELKVIGKKLQPKYWFRNWLWNKLYLKIVSNYAKKTWNDYPIVAYPLMIDISFGTMKYYYFKYGIKGIEKRIKTYNKVIANMIEKRNLDDEINVDQFYIQRTLTSKKSIAKQLDEEFSQIY